MLNTSSLLVSGRLWKWGREHVPANFSGIYRRPQVIWALCLYHLETYTEHISRTLMLLLTVNYSKYGELFRISFASPFLLTFFSLNIY